MIASAYDFAALDALLPALPDDTDDTPAGHGPKSRHATWADVLGMDWDYTTETEPPVLLTGAARKRWDGATSHADRSSVILAAGRDVWDETMLETDNDYFHARCNAVAAMMNRDEVWGFEKYTQRRARLTQHNHDV